MDPAQPGTGEEAAGSPEQECGEVGTALCHPWAPQESFSQKG